MDAFFKALLAALLDVIDQPAIQQLVLRPAAHKLAEFIPGEVADDKIGAALKLLGQELIDANVDAPPPA